MNRQSREMALLVHDRSAIPGVDRLPRKPATLTKSLRETLSSVRASKAVPTEELLPERGSAEAREALRR